MSEAAPARPSTVDALILDLLEWLQSGARPYREVMDAWKTSCPRLPIWEEANARRLVERVRADDGPRVELTDDGRAFLARYGRCASGSAHA